MKTGSGRRGVRKNAKKRPSRQSAALDALERRRLERREAADRARICLLTKLSCFGWTTSNEPLDLDENGGIQVARAPGAYTVALHYDPLLIKATTFFPKFENPQFEVITTIEHDVEFIKSSFEIPDEDWPAPSTFGPWALRVRYDDTFMRGQNFMSNHHAGLDLRLQPVMRDAEDAASRSCVLYTDDNAEELVVHIRFTPEQEATLDELLRDMRGTGRMRAVEEFLMRNGLRV